MASFTGIRFIVHAQVRRCHTDQPSLLETGLDKSAKCGYSSPSNPFSLTKVNINDRSLWVSSSYMGHHWQESPSILAVTSYFTTREHSASCFPEISFADNCQSAKRLFLCGGSNQTQVCAIATDSSGFRIFNDDTACPWGEPLLWYSTLDGPLEGQHVTLASVNEAVGCNPGQRFAHPFITDWRGSLPDLAKQYSSQGITLTNSTSSWKDSTQPCADTADPGVILAGGYLSFGTVSPTSSANRCNRTLDHDCHLARRRIPRLFAPILW